MTREERIKTAIEKGYTCNPETGEVFGMKGKPVGKTDSRGRKIFAFRTEYKNEYVMFHQFIWYWVNGMVVDCIDHIDRNPSNNKIDNLRAITHQKNLYNRTVKGFTRIKRKNGYKFRAQIVADGTFHYLGLFDNEYDANQAYLKSKDDYQII